MSRDRSAALPLAYVVLRVCIIVNWLIGLSIFGLLIAIIVAEQWTFSALHINAASGIPEAIGPLRVAAALALAAIPVNDAILRRLLAMVVTVRQGDPFVAENAFRLQAIAWFLLALQLISLTIGAIGKMISTHEPKIHLDAGFSPSGWLAVILAFVLARVFAEGTLMRDDLEGTV